MAALPVLPAVAALALIASRPWGLCNEPHPQVLLPGGIAAHLGGDQWVEYTIAVLPLRAETPFMLWADIPMPAAALIPAPGPAAGGAGVPYLPAHGRFCASWTEYASGLVYMLLPWMIFQGFALE